MPTAIQVTDLHKHYGDVHAVAGVSFTAEQGTCLGLLGPNGAGKTTTIEILEGLRDADSGEVSILGLQWAASAQQIRASIGVQLQETRFQEKLTVAETLRMFRAFYHDGYGIDELLELVALQPKAGARVRTLSGGQQQRLALACAIVNKPQVLFLDEPTTGLDPQARRRVWEVVERFKERGGTVLLTTHYMDEAERLADQLVIFDQGKIIAEGAPREIIARLGADNIVEIIADQDTRDRLDQAALEQIEGVQSVRPVAGALALAVVDPTKVLPRILKVLEQQEVVLEDLRTHRSTLEDVFVTLTGKHLRDG